MKKIMMMFLVSVLLVSAVPVVIAEDGPSNEDVDLNGDGVINAQDVKLVEGLWGITKGDFVCKYPGFDDNPEVGAGDLAVVLGNFGPVNKPEPHPRNVRFRGRNAEDVKVDGLEIKPTRTYISGNFRESNGNYRGTVRVSIDGYSDVLSITGLTDSSEKIRLRYRGKINDVDIKKISLDEGSTLTSGVFYDIHSSAKYLTLYHGRTRLRFANAELGMTYNPGTGKIDVYSINGVLIQKASVTSLSTDGVAPRFSNLVRDLGETYAMGFE